MLAGREVGYCQGSAFIVGLLLMQMPEEESFAVLVKIMQDYRMREMFKPSMAELGLCMYQAGHTASQMCSSRYIHIYRVAEPCHFSAAPAPEPSIFFTAPAPTYIASHQFLEINAYGTLFFPLNCFMHGSPGAPSGQMLVEC